MATVKEIVFYGEEKDTKTPFCIYIRVKRIINTNSRKLTPVNYFEEVNSLQKFSLNVKVFQFTK